MTTKTVGEVLRGAADRVRQGWARHTLLSIDGSVCAVGGIRATTGSLKALAAGEHLALTPLEMAAVAEVVRHLPPTIKIEHYPVLVLNPYGKTLVPFKADPLEAMTSKLTSWNDNVAKNAEEVATLLEFAALMYEERQKFAAENCGQTEPSPALAR